MQIGDIILWFPFPPYPHTLLSLVQHLWHGPHQAPLSWSCSESSWTTPNLRALASTWVPLILFLEPSLSCPPCRSKKNNFLLLLAELIIKLIPDINRRKCSNVLHMHIPIWGVPWDPRTDRPVWISEGFYFFKLKRRGDCGLGVQWAGKQFT